METYSPSFHSALSTQPYGVTPQCLQKPPCPVAEPRRYLESSVSPPSDRKSAGAVWPRDGRWVRNSPANDGTKVVVSDTDHYSPFAADALWAWKSMLRGHNPILSDLGIINIGHLQDAFPGAPPYESYEPARQAMGDTLRLAETVDLAQMQPQGALSSTGYLLANPGHEYLVLQPGESNASFTVTLNKGTYTVRWYGVNERKTASADDLVVERDAATSLRAPAAITGPAVLHLKRVGG